MIYDFDRIIDRHGTSSMKWEKYRDTDVIPMWVADMDFSAPPQVLEALHQRIKHGVLGYTLVPDGLTRTVVNRMKSVYAWDIQKEWLVWIPGIVSALNVACRAFGKSDENIVTTVPIYPPFLSAPGNAGKNITTVPMRWENQRAVLDIEALKAAFKKGASLFLFCTPHNPCGTVFKKNEIKTLVDLCDDYNVIICSDEIHCDLVLEAGARHIPTPAVSDRAASISFTLMAPSKTYNIPGLDCSFAVIPDEGLRGKFKTSMAGIVPSINVLGLTAAGAAYEFCGEWLDRLIIYLRKNRDMVIRRVNRMKGCSLGPIEATYLAWIDVRQTGLEDPIEFFEKAGVGLSDGAFFGQEGFIRLNFGCPASLLEKGLNRMAKALDEL